MDSRVHKSWPAIHCKCFQCEEQNLEHRNVLAISHNRTATVVTLFLFTGKDHNGMTLDLGALNKLLKELHEVQAAMQENERK